MDARHNTNIYDTFTVLPHERLLDVKGYTPEQGISRRAPSSLRALYRLTHARSDSEVGLYGPALAALPEARDDQTDTPEHQGLYSVVFGRDSLRVALDLVEYYPRLARTTILRFAETQGITYHTTREEEPGRIAHELRDPSDPIAQELTHTRGWDWPYYGSVDATPQFIRTLHAYCSSSDESDAFLFQHYKNRDQQPRIVADALTYAVDWVTTRMDQNAEGLLEYQPAFEGSIENQAWKDSWDAYHHADGTLANHTNGIASIEVQSVTHEALLDAAELYERTLNRPEQAAKLRRRAHGLARTILREFWIPEKGGYFALGTDRDEHDNLRQLKIRTSNMGHVLNSRIIDGDSPEHAHKRAALLQQLQSPELLTQSGIRTLARDEVRFREGAYHNGSVWLWDTHHIAKGARRHAVHDPAFAQFADELDRRILHVVNTLGSFPEYVRGGDTIAVNTRIIEVEDTTQHRINRVEQPPQEIQAWTVAAVLAVKRQKR